MRDTPATVASDEKRKGAVLSRLVIYLLYGTILSHWVMIFPIYIYPVVHRDASSVILTRQDDSGILRLMMWNCLTDDVEPLLPRYYYPVELSVLPDCSGISFIDNDRLRIKYYNKRSATSYDMPYPLYNLHGLTWIGPRNLVFVAQYHEHYALCHVTINKACSVTIMADAESDYLSPSYIDGDLVYIRRTHTHEKTIYYLDKISQVNSCFEENAMDQETAKVTSLHSTQTMIYFESTAIIYVHMEQPDFGWAINLPTNIQEKNLSFTCYLIRRFGNTWKNIPAFVFTIPRSMIFGDDTTNRLSESLRPLLPKYIQESLYFCSLGNNGFLQIYRYDLSNATTECLTSPKIHDHLFAPLSLGSMVICGGSRRDCIWQLFNTPQESGESVNKSYHIDFLT